VGVEAIYYIPDAEKFVRDCARVLRPGGKVLKREGISQDGEVSGCDYPAASGLWAWCQKETGRVVYKKAGELINY
jgi:2-polyprenyl-3-methyl-5-hydroxy-6-metoxy-1,4-benzoquinol methylase